MTKYINVAEWLAAHAGESPEPYAPYTAQEQERILKAFGQSSLSPKSVLKWVTSVVGLHDGASLISVGMPDRQDVKDRLKAIEKASDKLLELLWTGLQPARPHVGDEPLDAAVVAVVEATGGDSEKELDLLRDLAWLSDRAAKAREEQGEAGRPRSELSNLLEMLALLWFAGHGRGKGEWRWGAPVKGRVNGPIGDFVRACTEPVLPPEKQASVESVLHTVLRRHPKSRE